MDEEAQNDLAIEYSEKDICDLLRYFKVNTYSVKNHTGIEPRPYMNDTIKLLEKDYIIGKIENKDGRLCPQYPAIIPIIETSRTVTTIYENELETSGNNMDITKMAEYFEDSKLARCRQRFPVPVIFVNGKYVCRSSTLASEPEMCYRTGLINVPGFELLQSIKGFWWPIEGLLPDADAELNGDDRKGPGPYDNDYRTQTICDRLRGADVKLLKCLNVNTIVDIMVEKRKVKHNLYVSASEKVDLKRYSIFKLISLPYPGCEFFKDYHDAIFNAEGLKYKWENPENDAVITVPTDNIKSSLAISWDNYKEWDLVLITQNYMKYILKRLQDDSSGLLLHCISGWDRTPLFISLIRLSLWADYLVHPTLNEYEILYFTLAYDWYLFGHHLSNRVFKNEEIMAFCFDFLRYITSEDFSARSTKKKHSDDIKTDDSRSPSRSSNSSLCADDIGHKKKKLHTGDYILMEMNENSNDSSTIPMDIGFEDSNSPSEVEVMDTACCLTVEAVSNFNTEDALFDAINDELWKSKTLSPSTKEQKGLRRTSPIPVGAGARRQRSESTGSNSSNISANWQMISDCGSVERDINLKPQRLQRLERVRTIFNSCYQKTVKNESFGPPTRLTIDEIMGTLSQWSYWFDLSYNPENGTNGNVEKNETEEEANGNGTRGKGGSGDTGDCSGDKVADTNSNE